MDKQTIHLITLIIAIIGSNAWSYTNLSDRMVALETRLTSLETRVDNIDKRLVTVETSLTALATRMTTMESPHDYYGNPYG